MPRGNLILVKKADPTSHLVPEEYHGFKKSHLARVVAKGDGAWNLATGTKISIDDIQVGDLVVLNGQGVIDFPEWRRDELALVTDNDVFAIIRD